MWLIIWVVVIGAAFLYAWRKGYLIQLRDYVNQTRDELKKCTWPTWDELKGQTVVVSIAIALLGGFTVIADRVFFYLVFFITKA